LDEILAADADTLNLKAKGSLLVYISGPNAFITTGEDACKNRHDRGVEWYGAKWDL